METVILSLLVWVFSILIYFLPTLCGQKKKNVWGIFILNLFLGWTFIGWVVALVWAACPDAENLPR